MGVITVILVSGRKTVAGRGSGRERTRRFQKETTQYFLIGYRWLKKPGVEIFLPETASY